MVSRTQKSRWSCYFLTQNWTSFYNLRLTQKKGLEKERWHFVVTLTVTHLRQLYNFRISTSQNIHKSCDFQTESRFILFSTFCCSGAAQRLQKVKCVVRLWHQVVHCVHQLASASLVMTSTTAADADLSLFNFPSIPGRCKTTFGNAMRMIKTRFSWFNCALRLDDAVYWVSIGHYGAVAFGN